MERPKKLMNQETSDLILSWVKRAKKETDPFIKFFIMYMCLDAWMTSCSGEEYDSNKLKWLKSKSNPLANEWLKISMIEDVQGLVTIGKVENMNPKHRGRLICLKDDDNFDQLVNFIYQIRCNLFHGGKSYINQNDKTLVTLSSKIIENWVEFILEKNFI